MYQKVALVTGGSNGIGASVCKELGKSGYFVYINYRNDSGLASQVLNEIVSCGGDGQLIKFDVRDVNQIRCAIEDFKHEKLDLLVNNAGVSKDGLLYQIEEQDFNDIINVNFWGAVNTFDSFKNKLINDDNSVVISIGSISGILPKKGQGAYAISKAMLIEWSEKQAQAGTNKDINFYTISPGPVATNMIKSTQFYNNPDVFKRIPLGRFAQPEEVAQIVLLLADNNSLIKNGANIVLDGGMTQAFNG